MKYSEKHIREEKVQKLKQKISKELEEKMRDKKQMLAFSLREDHDDELVGRDVLELACLIRFKNYIDNYDRAFLERESWSEERDFINYTIDNNYIDVYLQEDFDFTHAFLFKCEMNGYNAHWLLSKGDDSFGYNFITLIEYHQRLERLQKEEGVSDV